MVNTQAEQQSAPQSSRGQHLLSGASSGAQGFGTSQQVLQGGGDAPRHHQQSSSAGQIVNNHYYFIGCRYVMAGSNNHQTYQPENKEDSENEDVDGNVVYTRAKKPEVMTHEMSLSDDEKQTEVKQPESTPSVSNIATQLGENNSVFEQDVARPRDPSPYSENDTVRPGMNHFGNTASTADTDGSSNSPTATGFKCHRGKNDHQRAQLPSRSAHEERPSEKSATSTVAQPCENEVTSSRILRSDDGGRLFHDSGQRTSITASGDDRVELTPHPKQGGATPCYRRLGRRLRRVRSWVSSLFAGGVVHKWTLRGRNN